MLKALQGHPLPLKLASARTTRCVTTTTMGWKKQNPGKPANKRAQKPQGLYDPAIIQPNNITRAFAHKYNIGSGQNKCMGRFPLRFKSNPSSIFVNWSNQHCFDIRRAKYLDAHENPFTKTILEHYRAQIDKPLWVQAYALGGIDKPVVTTKSTRWLKRGLRLALEQCGYDVDGRKVLKEGEKPMLRELYGTLRVHCPKPKILCQQPFELILEQMTAIIKGLENHLRQEKIKQSFVKKPTHTQGATKPRNRYS